MNLTYVGATTIGTICESSSELVQILGVVRSVLTIIQIAIPILLIIMGSIDLMKAVMAGKEDEIKKAQGTFVKRAIAAVIVFFIPLIVNLVMGLITIDTTDSGDPVKYQDCWRNARG